MATATTPNAKSGVAPRWAIVRHYIVLLSSDKDKKDTNRVWHDGKLAQHTYNGKLVLYDEANIEIADGFKSSLSTQLLPDGHEVTLGEYVIQVQTFERVSRTDLNLLGPATPVQQQRQQQQSQQQQIPREQQQMGRHVGAHTPPGIVRGGQVATEQGRLPAQVSPATNTASASTTSSSSSSSAASTTAGPTRTLPGNSTPRRGPKSTHTFRTPFKRVSEQASLAVAHDGVSSPSTTTAAKVVAGDTEEKSEGEARGKKRRVDMSDGRDGQKDDADVR
ncbi:unnamed protein product [Jaminaea pallidilutea]